jgi:hypothetical protein
VIITNINNYIIFYFIISNPLAGARGTSHKGAQSN